MYDSPLISPENKDSAAEIVSSLPKVLLDEDFDAALAVEKLQNPDALREAVGAAVKELAEDNVAYVELTLNPERFTQAEMSIDDVIAAAQSGLLASDIDARLVLGASRRGGKDAEIARACVENLGEKVVGFHLGAGQESLTEFSETFAYLRHNYVPFSVDVGAGSSDIAEAVQAGATRLRHASGVIDDFSAEIEGIVPGQVSAWIRDRKIPLDFAPLNEIEVQAVEELADHPLPLLQQLGFTCTVGTGQRQSGALSKLFIALSETFGYGLEEFFDLTVKAIDNTFSNQEHRQALMETSILPAYEELSDAELAGPDTVESLAEQSAEDSE